MSPTLGRVFAAAITLCALTAAPAFAGDFNFTVPVELTNMPTAIQRGNVECRITNSSNPSAAIGTARSADFTVTSGRFSGNVLVEVNARPEFHPSQANRYTCTLWLQVRLASGSSYFYTAYALGQPTGPIEGRLLYSPTRRGDYTEGSITPPS